MTTSGHLPKIAKGLSPSTLEDLSNRERGLSWRLPPATYCIVLLTVAAAILRISFLGSKSLWLDESTAAYRATLPLASLLKVTLKIETNMFVYYLVLHGWTSVAGSGEFMLRLPSALFDTAIVPLVYALGVELGNRRAGLLAALMMTVNATSIQYAQTARSYSMYVALATLAAVLFVRSVKRDSLAGYAGYIASGTLDVYAHLFGIFSLPAQWLSIFLFRPGRKAAIRLTLCVITIGVLSLPAFYFGIRGYHGNIAWVPKTSFQSLVEMCFTFAGAIEGRPTGVTRLLTALYMVGVALAILRTPRSDRPALGYLLLSISVPVGLTIAISFVMPLFMARYLLAELPLFALLAAIGFQRSKPALLIAIVFAISTLGLADDYSYYCAPPQQDWRGTVDFVATHSQSGDMLVIYPDYYRTPIAYYVSRRDHPETFPTIVPVTPRGNMVEGVAKLLAASDRGAARRVWLTFPTFQQQLDGNALRLILQFHRAQVTEEPEFSGVNLFLVERTD